MAQGQVSAKAQRRGPTRADIPTRAAFLVLLLVVPRAVGLVVSFLIVVTLMVKRRLRTHPQGLSKLLRVPYAEAMSSLRT